MNQPETIYVAGHRGMVGSAIVRQLLAAGHPASHIVTRTHNELDLTDQAAVREFFAAAQRGGDWVDYEVVNPVTGAVDEKTSFILPLGTDRVIGCGVFKPKGGFSLQVQ